MPRLTLTRVGGRWLKPTKVEYNAAWDGKGPPIETTKVRCATVNADIILCHTEHGRQAAPTRGMSLRGFLSGSF